MIQEQEKTGTFLQMFTFLFERKGMSQGKFVEYINAQSMEDHPPYRHIAPLNKSTLSRILAGNVPDPDTLYRIAFYGFGLNKELCCKLEDMRWEAYLLSQEEKRTTQQLVAIRKELEPKEVEKKKKSVPDWVLS